MNRLSKTLCTVFEVPFITYERQRIENEFNKQKSMMREQINNLKTNMEEANKQYKDVKGRVLISTVSFIKTALKNLTNRENDEDNREEKL